MDKVSVLLATFRRNDLLNMTLESFTRLNKKNLEVQFIVVDNGVEEETRILVESYRNELRVCYLSEPTPGKNSALNTGLKIIEGDIVVLTDDDIIADEDWLVEIVAGTKRHPYADLFGGRILPNYPKDFVKSESAIDFNHWFIRSAYVISDWEQAEGEIKAGRIWGPNMAIRSTVFKAGIQFNPDIGPNGEEYVMGSETEFLRRASANGHKSVYLPRAIVKHQIRKDQLSLNWLEARAYRAGRGQAALGETAPSTIWLMGAPRYLWRKLLIAKTRKSLKLFKNKIERFDNIIELNFIKGQIDQYRRHE